MMRRLCAAAVVGLTTVAPPGQDAARSGGHVFQGEDALVRAYEVILEARFDEVAAELRQACGPAPAEACDVLHATAIWWRILLDPESRALDPEFTAAVERAVRSTEAWTARAPDDAEAWFYKGAAYALRVQWRVLRSEKLAAARDGRRIRDALEKALERAPELHDALFGIGLYKYYAGVAPAAVRFLRFLLLLPGGDREEGLREMLRARERGRLLRGEADYQLHLIYLWYEHDTARALDLLDGLQRQYPTNPLFLIRRAEIQDGYLHDITATLETWRTVLALARESRVQEAGIAETRARLAIAEQLDTLHQTDRAIEQLEELIRTQPTAPYGATALAYLRLGEAHDRLGDRSQALDAYRQAVAAVPAGDRLRIRDRATRGLRRQPDAQAARAYRLSLEGWRLFEAGDRDGGAEALAASTAIEPRDPVARYRYGRILQADFDEEGALEQYVLAIRDATRAPAPIAGAIYLDAARLQERAGERDVAIAWYQRAATLFGAAEETRVAAARALARLEK